MKISIKNTLICEAKSLIQYKFGPLGKGVGASQISDNPDCISLGLYASRLSNVIMPNWNILIYSNIFWIDFCLLVVY